MIPFFFGTLLLMPVMTYIGDVFNYSYNGNFFIHYGVFFTKFTDLTGADGGFSMGQFWFLLYLMVISLLSAGIISLFKKFTSKPKRETPLWLILLLGLPLPFLSEILSIGGKSLAEYTYLFLIGYFVISDDKTTDKLQHHRLWLLAAGLSATFLNVYLFVWSGKNYDTLNTITNFISRWFMILALTGIAKKHLNFNGKISAYMSTQSFLFYIYHFIWVVLFQFLLYKFIGNRTLILFAGTVILSYITTFACCELTLRIPLLCFLTGTKPKPQK